MRHILITGLVLLLPIAARAQQRPLVTEDPETIGAGRMLVEVGLDYVHDTKFTVSGLEGHHLRLPSIGVSMGAGPNAEIQIDGALYQRLAIRDRFAAPLAHMVEATGSSTSSIEASSIT